MTQKTPYAAKAIVVKRPSGPVKRKKTLKAEVTAIKKALKEDHPVSKYIYKLRESLNFVWSANTAGYTQVKVYDPSTIETVVSTVPFQRAFAPATVGSADLTTVTTHQKIPIEIFGELLIRNNYNIPFRLDVYLIEFKNSCPMTTSQVVNELAMDFAKAGITNAANPDAAVNNPTMYPSESPWWRQNVKVMDHHTVKVEVGDELRFTSASKITYDQEWLDQMVYSSAVCYERYHRLWFLRAVSCISHDDTTNTLVGFAPGGLDYIAHTKYELAAPSDMKSLFYTISGSYDTQTTANITAPDTGVENVTT